MLKEWFINDAPASTVANIIVRVLMGNWCKWKPNILETVKKTISLETCVIF